MTERRGKGRPDKLTSDVRRMVLEALVEAGGSEYLKKQAEETPSAFLALVGKIMAAPPGEKEGGAPKRPPMSDFEVARRLAFLIARGEHEAEAAMNGTVEESAHA